MAANVDEYLDPSMNYGSWVELYNSSDSDFDLGGMYVSDERDNLLKHRLTDDYGVIPSHGFGILNFDHHEVWTPHSYRQIDFKLDCDGGEIILSDGISIIAEATYPESVSRTSYARISDGGGTWGMCGAPTPGKSNIMTDNYSSSQLEPPIIDKNSQLFTGNIDFNVIIPDGCTLIYTTDGSTPTLSNGTSTNNGSFNINETTCFRFRLFQNGYLPSPVVSRSFILDNHNYPFPIVSILIDPKNLYNDSIGLFNKSDYGRPGNSSTENCNWNMDWERPISLDYITTNNQCELSQECNLSISGGYTRSRSPHSFNLKSDKIFDFKNRFDAQFFKEKPYLHYKSLKLRNGGNDSDCRIKDGILQEVARRSGMIIDSQCWQPVHVFINGEHYSVLNLRESNNHNYALSSYGYSSDKVDYFEVNLDSGYVQKRGSKESFNRLLALSTNSSDSLVYEEIRSLLDIDEYINYMSIELFLANRDWPDNNVKGFRSQEDGRFHIILYDLDLCYSTFTPFKDFFDKEYFDFEPLHGYDYSTSTNLEGTHRYLQNEFVTLFKNLLKNPRFHKQFIDTYSLIGGSVYLQNIVHDIALEMSSYLNQGGYVDSSPMANYISRFFVPKYRNDMLDEMLHCPEMLMDGISGINVKIRSNTPWCRLKVNDLEIPGSYFDGHLFLPCRLNALAPSGYRFCGWKDAKSGFYLSSSDEYNLSESSESIELIAEFEPLSDESVSTVSFPIRINELSASNSVYVNEYFRSSDWIELYNISDYPVDVSGMYLSDEESNPEKYVIPSFSLYDSDYSTIIPSHGHLVIWCDHLNTSRYIHTGFNLSNTDGSCIILSSSDGKSFDKMSYKRHERDVSIGRYPDGCDSFYNMPVRSPGKSNKIDSYSTVAELEHETSGIDFPGIIDSEQISIIFNDDGSVGLHSISSSKVAVSIYRIDGTKVFYESLHSYGYVLIDLNEIDKGIYFIEVTDDRGEKRISKWLKR